MPRAHTSTAGSFIYKCWSYFIKCTPNGHRNLCKRWTAPAWQASYLFTQAPLNSQSTLCQHLHTYIGQLLLGSSHPKPQFYHIKWKCIMSKTFFTFRRTMCNYWDINFIIFSERKRLCAKISKKPLMRKMVTLKICNLDVTAKLSTRFRLNGENWPGWPDWANVRPMGDCLPWVVVRKIQQQPQFLGNFNRQ
jgi:hypothetical protein